MAFENSPRLESPGIPRRSFKRWLFINRRIMLVIIAILAVITLAVALFFFLPLLRPVAPGGLEACLITPSGKPVVTTVRISNFSRVTGTNGCFFFPSIPPGNYQLIVVTTSKDVMVPVTIVSNEAVDLESITITP